MGAMGKNKAISRGGWRLKVRLQWNGMLWHTAGGWQLGKLAFSGSTILATPLNHATKPPSGVERFGAITEIHP